MTLSDYLAGKVFYNLEECNKNNIVSVMIWQIYKILYDTGELGYDGPLYDRFLHMTDNMLGPSPMHIKYSSYVYDGFCI